MKQNFKILLSILSIAGIVLVVLSVVSTDHAVKMNLFYVSAGLAVAVLVCYVLFKRKSSSFENKSNNL